ncbi:DsbA family protein [uncultured Roseibium sp.]|uniref:2-hydroxychromene-2-carboxylate isomerase n=1 Tax=uncultured Roseibium sp. TaxID=1936171 RepID=UPI002625612A|nr:DsbA family protein [uncultured Roseibium sp.]
MATIEYVYSAHSGYAYLGSAELLRICADNSVTLIHRPILLSPVIDAQRAPSFRGRTQQHVDYFFGREIERWAEFRNVPIINYRPSRHDADYSLASGMILALGETGQQTDAMAHGLLEAHWRDDMDLSDLAALKALATSLGHDADALLAKAGSAEMQSWLQANTRWAQEKNVFGSPTYFVDGDPFYGQDHLELVKRALHTPFKAPGWSNPPVK